MAGDIEIHEHVVIAHPGKAETAAMSAEALGAKVLHRYGDRVHIVQAGPESLDVESAAASPAAAEVSESLLAELDEVERLGVMALGLRQSGSYVQAKRNRPRQGEPWEMYDCTRVGIPPQGSVGAPTRAAGSGAPPTSSYLEGSVAVGIVIVEGPNANLQFSQQERTKVVAEVQNGLSFYAAQNPAAGLTFTYDIQIIPVTVQPDPNAPDKEALWRDPAMGALGFTADWTGVAEYVDDIRNRFGTRWTYCGFFTKYPLDWFAYASIGGPRLVMQYDNDGWGPDNIDRVFAHESGHIFGCPDEYAASNCDCAGQWGRFGRPNGNCQNCAPGGGTSCIMKGNDWAMCNWTPSHLGWVARATGDPVLIQSRFGTQGNFELAMPTSRGLFSLWRNNDDMPALPWNIGAPAGEELGLVSALSLIQSNFGSPGNLEVVARVGEKLFAFWRDSGPTFTWNGPTQISADGVPITGVTGAPVLVQSRCGTQGNL